MLRALAQLMAMDETTWRRHANPWSVWSRFAIVPFVALAVWSRIWLGWGALAPIAAVAAFTFLNPRLFPPPRTLDGWPQRAVTGERIYLAGKAPARERRTGTVLNVLAGLSLLPFGLGLWRFDAGLTCAGMAGVIGFKLWFVRRMARLYDRTQQADRPD